MEEAIIAIHKVRSRSRTLTHSLMYSHSLQKLEHLEHGSAEFKLLEQCMHVIRRCSGSIRLAPDEFVITSLDVVIYKHEELGESGFSQVFRGDWQGLTVAVKVFKKGIPQPVRTIFKSSSR